MKNNVKKISLLFALILASSALFGVFGVSAEELIVNDYDIVFQENTGILKISGEQGMEDFYLELFDDNPDTGMPEYSYTTPWYVYADKAVKVKVSGDINRISKNAFPEFDKMTSLHLTEKITEIEKTAFKDCTSLEKIYFGGSEAEWAAMTAETENLGNVTVYYEIPECTHEFVNYVSDNNATYFADGTKTAVCSLSEYCGETDTVTDTGSKLKLGKTSKITATQTKNSVTLKWNKVSKANAYRVYQRSGSSWKLIATTTSNTYKVEKLSAGTKYTFAVKACYVQGGKTAQAPSYTSFTTPTKPAKTTKISTSSTDTSIKLTWYKVKGATGYRIYVYNNGWKAVKTTTSNTYTVQNLKVGTKYTYAVKAYTKYNGAYIWASEYTSYKTATCPAKPAELKATKTTTSVTLSWSKVAGATGYRIYQYNPTTKSWDIVRKATTATKYTIKNLQGNKNYIFAVRPYIKNDTAYVYSKGFTQIKVKTNPYTYYSDIPSFVDLGAFMGIKAVDKDVSYKDGFKMVTYVYYSSDVLNAIYNGKDLNQVFNGSTAYDYQGSEKIENAEYLYFWYPEKEILVMIGDFYNDGLVTVTGAWEV